mgnify:FL=1
MSFGIKKTYNKTTTFLSRKYSSQSLSFNKYEKTDFYNAQKSQPIHPLLKNQETHLKKGQLVLTTQTLNQYKNSKTKPTYFMDIGEKELVSYNLKPWIQHQLIHRTYKSNSEVLTDSKLKNTLFLWNHFKSLYTNADFVKSNPGQFDLSQRKGMFLEWLKTKNFKSLENNIEFPYYQFNEKHAQQITTSPHITRQLMHYNNTWNWLSKCWKKNHILTGRIGRSLRHAGVCILIGGFVAFLPKGESSLKQKRLINQQGALKSLQPIGLRYQNLNIIVTRDKTIQSTWYRFSKRKFA